MGGTDPRRGLLIALAVAAADQASKALALARLDPADPVSLIGGFLRLTLRYNSGAAFSLGWGGPVVLAALGVTAAVMVVAALFRWKGRRPADVAGLGLILGGALGNLADRALHGGAVVDFIDLGTSGFRWPTFNVADIAISFGAAMLIILHHSGRDGSNA